MILSEPSGGSVIGEFGIFLLVAIAAVIHSLGRVLQHPMSF
jgi:hypothetical protein